MFQVRLSDLSPTGIATVSSVQSTDCTLIAIIDLPGLENTLINQMEFQQ